MENIVYLSVVLFLSGCASVSVSDLSRDPKYSEYVGRQFELKGSALICKDGYPGDASGAQPKGNELILTDRDVCHYGGALAKVPKGTIVTVEKVVMHHHIPPLWRHIYLVGNLKLADSAPYAVYYFLGFDGDENATPP